MIEHDAYGKRWLLDEDQGQVGLLHEDHYKTLFSPTQCPYSFQSTDVWLDIGGNIGAFCIRAADYVQEVVAYEPEPRCFEQLQMHKKLNGVTNVTLVRAAVVGTPETTVQLALSNNYSSTHRVGNVRGRKSISVSAVNIDDAVATYSANKIKMDCEGSELEILENMDLGPIEEIVFEYHFSMFKSDGWKRFWAILDRLEDFGFEVLKKPGQESKTWHTIVWARKGGRGW